MTDFTFTESAPYEHYNRVDAQMVYAVDVFALTDKGAAFVATEYRPLFNGQQIETDSRCHNIDARGRKKRFCQSGGKYYLSYHCLSGSFDETPPGSFDNPLDFLMYIERRSYTFQRELSTIPMFIQPECTDSIPFVTFHGNLNEVSAAFGYVIYDDGILTAVIDAANRILARDGQARWEYKDGEVRRRSK